MIRLSLAIIVLLLNMLSVQAEETAAPEDVVRDVVTGYLSVLEDNQSIAATHPSYAMQVFREEVKPELATEAMATKAMGEYAQRASVRQLDAFSKAFNSYLAQTWVNLFASVDAKEIRWYPTEYPKGKNRAVVIAKLGSRWFGTRLKFKLNWVDGWQINDIDVNNHSIVRGTRADFREAVADNSIARALASYIKQAPAQPEVTLGATDWGPYISSSLPDNGLAAAIVSAAYEAVGYHLSLKFMPLKKLNSLAVSGNLDGMVAAWRYQSDDSVELTSPYLTNRLVFIKRDDDPFALTEDAHLAKSITPEFYRLGVYGDVNYGGDLAVLLEEFTLKERDYCLQLFHDVATKSLDLAIVDEWVASIELKRGANIASHLSVVSPSIDQRDVFVSVQKTGDGRDDLLVDAFNSGLSLIKKNGTYDAILKKHNYSQ